MNKLLNNFGYFSCQPLFRCKLFKLKEIDFYPGASEGALLSQFALLPIQSGL